MSIERQCVKCNKSFSIPLSTSKKTKGSGTHCSNECRQKRVTNKCLHCHKPFSVRLSEKRIKYCSRPCYYEGKRVTKEHRLEKARVNRRMRVARLYAAEGDFSIEYFKWLCGKLNNLCVKCNTEFPQQKLTIDHMVAITSGGKNDNSNIQPLCGSCNAKKGNFFIYQDKRVLKLYKQYARNT